nr:precorrin-6y C5,15-methyltransferase (decarboxylating) subunit CbiE [Nocardioides sp. DJM-14]
MRIVDAGVAPVGRDPLPVGRAGRDPLPVIGIGADGWSGLGDLARALLVEAEVVLGARRQLDLLPGDVTAERTLWPSPFDPTEAIAAQAGRRVVVLASGDPMTHGLGRTLAAALGPESLRVIPAVSSVSLACARLGWPTEHTPVVSTLTGDAHALLRHAGGRALVLSVDGGTPAEVGRILVEHGWGESELTVLGDLGTATESSHRVRADAVAGPYPRLNVVAVEFAGRVSWPEVAGLPDEAFEHDGQLTKREVRAVTLSTLAPRPGEALWDIGGGSGSIGIEWMRAGGAAAISIERDAERAARIERNARALGVPQLRVVVGTAPEALAGLAAPDAVFIGGGLTGAGVVDAAWAALRPGGRLVANAVTLESAADLVTWREKLGGTLTRLEVARAGDVGAFTGWRAALPVVQWIAIKPEESP